MWWAAQDWVCWQYVLHSDTVPPGKGFCQQGPLPKHLNLEDCSAAPGQELLARGHHPACLACASPEWRVRNGLADSALACLPDLGA